MIQARVYIRLGTSGQKESLIKSEAKNPTRSEGNKVKKHHQARGKQFDQALGKVIIRPEGYTDQLE